jgi:Ca2+-binding RTX toxin-like protein
MIGGAGNDIHVVDNPGDAVIENAAEGTDTVIASVNHALLAGVENLILAAGAGAINGTGNALDNAITGNAGNNVLTGGGGNDTIDGGTGGDTAVFSQGLGQYTIRDFGAKILVSGPDGSDTMTSIEHLQFADTTLNVVDDGNALFDVLYYFSRNTDVYFAGANALEHYNAFGRHEGRDPNGLFDTSGYLAVN